MRSTRLVKVRFKKTGAASDYATSEAIRSLFQGFEIQRNLPVFDVLKILIERKVNSLSFTRDKPYFYLYSRLDENEVSIKINDLEKEIEVSMATPVLRTIIESLKNP
jgi:hypothetical protein